MKCSSIGLQSSSLDYADKSFKVLQTKFQKA